MKFFSAILFCLFASSLLTNETNAVVLTNMVRLFRGDGNLVDSAGSGNDLVEVNGVFGGFYTYSTQTLPTGTQPRQVFYFPNNSANQFLRGSAAGLPGGNAARTMMAWYKRVAATGNGPFGYGEQICNQNYAATMPTGSGTPLKLDLWCNRPMNNIIDPENNNIWYHIAFTWDGNRHTAYVDGAQVQTATGSPPNTNVNGGAVVIGGHPTGTNNPSGKFTGYVADFAIFSRALSASEVLSVYQDPMGLSACTSGSDCASGFCGNGACKSNNNIGSSCDNSEAAVDCASGYCANNICTDGQVGSVCDAGENADCVSGVCDPGTNTCVNEPSSSPSQRPSVSPSLKPSLIPSDSPSKSPSHYPSFSPSSHQPSINPSNVSQMPSDVPTFTLTQNPSNLSFNKNTSSPSSSDSTKPSRNPTTAPSVVSSSKPVPTIYPSEETFIEQTTILYLALSASVDELRNLSRETLQNIEVGLAGYFVEKLDFLSASVKLDLYEMEEHIFDESTGMRLARKLQFQEGAIRLVASIQSITRRANSVALHETISNTVRDDGEAFTNMIISIAGGSLNTLTGYIASLEDVHPSTSPSSQPSTQPSASPSTSPSSQPSTQPFSNPSTLPSSQPSAQPYTGPSIWYPSNPSTETSSLPSSILLAKQTITPSSSAMEIEPPPSSTSSNIPSGKPSFTTNNIFESRPSDQPASNSEYRDEESESPTNNDGLKFNDSSSKSSQQSVLGSIMVRAVSAVVGAACAAASSAAASSAAANVSSGGIVSIVGGDSSDRKTIGNHNEDHVAIDRNTSFARRHALQKNITNENRSKGTSLSGKRDTGEQDELSCHTFEVEATTLSEEHFALDENDNSNKMMNDGSLFTAIGDGTEGFNGGSSSRLMRNDAQQHHQLRHDGVNVSVSHPQSNVTKFSHDYFDAPLRNQTSESIGKLDVEAEARFAECGTSSICNNNNKAVYNKLKKVDKDLGTDKSDDDKKSGSMLDDKQQRQQRSHDTVNVSVSHTQLNATNFCRGYTKGQETNEFSHEVESSPRKPDISINEKLTIAEGGLTDDWDLSLKEQYMSNRDALAGLMDYAEKGELSKKTKADYSCDNDREKENRLLAFVLAIAVCKMSHGLTELSTHRAHNYHSNVLVHDRINYNSNSMDGSLASALNNKKSYIHRDDNTRKNEDVVEESFDEENQLQYMSYLAKF